jgi:hypothetical protein
MIHYGKEPSGDLSIRVSTEDVGEVFEVLQTAGLLQRRTFNGLRDYLTKNFQAELEQYRSRMTAQIPLIERGEGTHNGTD